MPRLSEPSGDMFRAPTSDKLRLEQDHKVALDMAALCRRMGKPDIALIHDRHAAAFLRFRTLLQ